MSGDFDFPDDQVDDDQADASTPLTASDELPRLILDAQLPGVIRARLSRREPVAVCIEVPGSDWVKPIADALSRRWPSALQFARDGSSRAEHKPDKGNDAVARALANGQAVVGISQGPARLLPSSLVTCADAHVTIRPPDAAVLRRLMRACAKGAVPRRLPAHLAHGLAFAEIACAFRGNTPPRRIVDHLVRSAAAKSQAMPGDTTPPLQDLPGFSGEVRQWGMDLVANVEAYRRGEVAWRSFQSAAVIEGPSGVGKTVFGKALAKACKVPFLYTCVGDWFGRTPGYLGDIAGALVAFHDQARSHSSGGCVAFIDEIDALPDRASLSDRHREWWLPIITLALTILDGAQSDNSGIIWLGAANEARLDPALIRPGRFERVFKVPLPDERDLAAVLRYHMSGALHDVDLAPLVRLGMPASNADAARWARDAMTLARKAGRSVTVDDVAAAIAPPDMRPASDIRRVAVHEAGHSVLQVLAGKRLESVSIVPSGNTGGRTRATELLPGYPTATDVDLAITVLLGGRAAEEAVLGSPSSGAESDLALATEIACSLVVSNGLRGWVHLAPTGRASELLRSDPALREKVEKHVSGLYAQALHSTRENDAAVRAVADALATKRLLTGPEVEAIVRAHSNTNDGGGHAN